MKSLNFKDSFYSLWLIPENTDPFQSWVNTNNEQTYTPHLTIVTKLYKKDMKPNLFKEQSILSLIPRRLHFGSSITMSLFIEFCLDVQLWNLRNHCLEFLDITDDERPFNPHMSLHYGELDFQDYLKKKSEYDQQLPERVRFNKIWLQKIHGTPDQWTTEEEFSLI